MKIAIYIVLVCGLSSCAFMQRSPYSGYSNYSDSQPLDSRNYYQKKRMHQVSEAKEELGYTKGQLNEAQAERLRQRIQLQNLESQLQTQGQKKQYYSLKPYFKNDQQRIQYLSLPSHRHQKAFIEYHGITTQEGEYEDSIASAIENNDIVKGMTRSAVRESWGDPHSIEVAGNPLFGNERWVYKKYVSTNKGYRKQQRRVLFENGRVSGWETASY